MNDVAIEQRKQKLSEYLNELTKHMVTRSTQYFEQMFELTPKVIIFWVKNYEGFEGLRQIQNKIVNFDDHISSDDKHEEVKQNIVDKSKPHLTIKSLMERNKAKKNTKRNIDSAHINSQLKKSSFLEPESQKTKKKRWYTSKVDKKNAIELSDLKQKYLEMEMKMQPEDDLKVSQLVDENRLLKELMRKKVTEMEQLKISKPTAASQRQSNKSIKLKNSEKISPNESADSNKIMSAQPSVPWTTLVSLFNGRQQNIPYTPQPLTLKEPQHKRKEYKGRSKDRRKDYVAKHRERPEDLYSDHYSDEDEYEEYELIEEDEESEEEDSGVVPHY